MIKLVFILLVISSEAFAAGKGVSSLLFPFVNGLLLLGFLIWKLKKPLSNMFATTSKDVEDLYLLAGKKDREARGKLEESKNRYSQVATESKNIMEAAEIEVSEYKKSDARETTAYIDRMKADVVSKIESEKVSALREINASLLDEVIAKAKMKISKDSGSEKKATDNLIAKIN